LAKTTPNTPSLKAKDKEEPPRTYYYPITMVLPRLLSSFLLFAPLIGTALSFAPPIGLQRHRHHSTINFVAIRRIGNSHQRSRLHAGGFEWEDPTSNEADPGVENPYKNPTLLKSSGDDSSLKVDPARLLSPRLRGCNLYFIGMMGSGKSTVGDLVARRMGTYNFLDTDTILERAAGMSIPQIFETEGEEAFRVAEAQVLDSVHAHVRIVVSTGGGLVMRNQNWSKLQTGLVVYLKVDPEVIMKRIDGTDRPLLQTDDPLETLKKLTNERKERYEQADVTVEITEDMTVDDVADKCIRALHDFIDDNPPAWKQAKAKAQADGLDWVQ
jgi:shikimate kinase